MITYTINEQEYDQLIKLGNKIICAGNGNLPGNSLGNDLGRGVIDILRNLQPNTQGHGQQSYEDWRSNFEQKVMRSVSDTYESARQKREAASIGGPHPDDVAVDIFAERMKSKLKKARERGKSGWQDPTWAAEQISQALRKHVEKGDPVDVANYCMFLSARGAGCGPLLHDPIATTRPLTQAQPSGPLTDEQIDKCKIAAGVTYRRHQGSVRGQQLTPADDFLYHFARAIEAAHGVKP